MPDLPALASFLDALLETNTYPAGENTRYRPSMRPVARLGLAVDADFDVVDWVHANQLDAVFLHRPWKIDDQPLPPGIGVLMAHAPFDDHLTLGINPRLALIMGLADWEPLGSKAGRSLGMLGRIAAAPFDTLRQTLEDIFGGLESAHAGTGDMVTTVAVVNAMTDTLVREAAARGAQVYVTGQERMPLGIRAASSGGCAPWRGCCANAGPGWKFVCVKAEE